MESKSNQRTKTSRKVKEFLDFLKSAELEYKLAVDEMSKEEKRTQDILHEIEFGDSKAERNKSATKLKQNRLARRKAKDIVEELRPVIEWYADRNNKRSMDLLQNTLGKVRKAEEYHSNRTYYPRVKDDGR